MRGGQTAQAVIEFVEGPERVDVEGVDGEDLQPGERSRERVGPFGCSRSLAFLLSHSLFLSISISRSQRGGGGGRGGGVGLEQPKALAARGLRGLVDCVANLVQVFEHVRHVCRRLHKIQWRTGKGVE